MDLESKLMSEHAEQTQALTSEHEEMMQELRTTLEQDKMKSIEAARDEFQAQVNELQKDHDEIMTNLETELAETKAKIDSAHSEGAKEATEKAEALMKEADANHSKIMELTKADHESTVSQLKAKHSKKVASLQSEKENIIHQSNVTLENKMNELTMNHSSEMAQLHQKMASHADEMKKFFQGKLQAAQQKYNEEAAALSQALKSREGQLGKVTSELGQLKAKLVRVEQEKDAVQTKVGSDTVIRQALQKKLDIIQKEVAEAVTTRDTIAAKLRQQQEQSEAQKSAFEKKLEQVLQERDESRNQADELSNKLKAMGANLTAMIDEKKEADVQLKVAKKHEAKLNSTEDELTSLRAQINTLKLDLMKSTSLLDKLQNEKESSERERGQRTIHVGMLEEQLAEANDKSAESHAKLEAAKYELSQKEETIDSIREELARIRDELAEAKNAQRQANEALAVAHKGADAKKSKTIETLQQQMQSLQQQMSKRSSAAQKLIQQREAECIELRKTNKILQQEVDKGSLSDRRIFELAAQQSNRESVATTEIEVRDKMVARLTDKLEAHDCDLADAEHAITSVQSQVQELARMKRREDVNIDYLKSIVVQYLSKPPGSSERGALLPVIATLLQFDAGDYKTIEDGKNKLTWWGTVAAIPIASPSKPSTDMAPLLGSSEITVNQTTRDELEDSRIRTSLQF